MDGLRIVRGRLTGPRTVELDEPVTHAAADVQVILGLAERNQNGLRLADFLRNLREGTRSKAEIDRQLSEERESWDNR